MAFEALIELDLIVRASFEGSLVGEGRELFGETDLETAKESFQNQDFNFEGCLDIGF